MVYWICWVCVSTALYVQDSCLYNKSPAVRGRGFFILRFYIVSGTLTLNIVRML